MVNKKGLSNPFNYTGSKHRYLDDLLEILPSSDHLAVLDPFLGGGDLSTHLNKSWAIDAIDINEQLIDMHNAIKTGELNAFNVNSIIKSFGLTKKRSPAFNVLRYFYNNEIEYKNATTLYALMCHSFANMIRFSGNNFNVSQAGDRNFNPSMQKKLTDYSNRLNERDISIATGSYVDFDFSLYDLILIDPPYLNTVATYNERGGWNESDETFLHEKITNECANNKFVYFGQTVSNGIKNNHLIEFAKKYNCKILRNTTKNCAATKTKESRKLETIEVMIYNF